MCTPLIPDQKMYFIPGCPKLMISSFKLSYPTPASRATATPNIPIRERRLGIRHLSVDIATTRPNKPGTLHRPDDILGKHAGAYRNLTLVGQLYASSSVSHCSRIMATLKDS